MDNKTFLYHVGEAFRAGERAGLQAAKDMSAAALDAGKLPDE
jgi:hypothetical protein